MALVDVNWTPNHRQLRQFGWLCMVMLPLLGWIWGAGGQLIGWLTATGLLLAMAGQAAPSVLRPFFLLLSVIAMPIGLVVGELAMLAVYFGVFLPIGLCFRLCKRDALQRSVRVETGSYWQEKHQPDSVSHYYRQS